METRDRIIHELTTMDDRKRRTDRHWNRHFLGLALQAMEGWDEDVTADGIESAFADRFTPTRETHGVARKVGLNLGVDRGRWIMPDGSLR